MLELRDQIPEVWDESPEELVAIEAIRPLVIRYRQSELTNRRVGRELRNGLGGGTGSGKTTAIRVILEHREAVGLADRDIVEQVRARPARGEEVQALLEGRAEQFGRFINLTDKEKFDEMAAHLENGTFIQAEDVGGRPYASGFQTEESMPHRPVAFAEYTTGTWKRNIEDGSFTGVEAIAYLVTSSISRLKQDLLARGGGKLPTNMARRIDLDVADGETALKAAEDGSLPIRVVQNPRGRTDGSGLQYDPNSREIPLAAAGISAVWRGDYSERHNQLGIEAGHRYLDFLREARQEFDFIDEV